MMRDVKGDLGVDDNDGLPTRDCSGTSAADSDAGPSTVAGAANTDGLIADAGALAAAAVMAGAEDGVDGDDLTAASSSSWDFSICLRRPTT